MAIQKINIEEFLALSKSHPVIDVRSPGEYNHAHIPGAHSLPLFTNEERAAVGTAYKQESREKAIKIGLDYFGPKMRKMVEEAEAIIGNKQQAINNNKQLAISKDSEMSIHTGLPIANCILIYCWRGGMRSGAVAWLLDAYGFKVYTLVGGYKKFRNRVLDVFKQKHHFNIIGGYTGSGKTELLNELGNLNEPVIDLESIAGHKGSAFGNIGLPKQPTQEMFENVLGTKLMEIGNRRTEIGSRKSEVGGQKSEVGNTSTLDRLITDSKIHLKIEKEKIEIKSQMSKVEQNQTSDFRLLNSDDPLPLTFRIWLEDESQRIGQVNIPHELWKTMRASPVYFLDIPFEERLKHIVEGYGQLDKQQMIDAIGRIESRLGGLEAKNAIQYLEEGNTAEAFRILLRYYDKWYLKGLHNREGINSLLHTISFENVNPGNAKTLLQKAD
jgi:tRNA 2-selenouridine synthase